MSGLQCRAMTAADIPAVAALFREMQAHYRVPCPADETIRRDLSALPPGTSILVATTPALVGFAAICTIFPGPGLKAGLFLKELFVSASARGQGAGIGLMRAVAAHAVAHGLSRVDWTADRTDTRLLAFYDGTGATAQDAKRFYRLAGDALAELAASPA